MGGRFAEQQLMYLVHRWFYALKLSVRAVRHRRIHIVDGAGPQHNSMPLVLNSQLIHAQLNTSRQRHRRYAVR